MILTDRIMDWQRNMVDTVIVGQQSATGAEQLLSASEELNRQAESLNEIVSQFKLKEKEEV